MIYFRVVACGGIIISVVAICCSSSCLISNFISSKTFELQTPVAPVAFDDNSACCCLVGDAELIVAVAIVDIPGEDVKLFVAVTIITLSLVNVDGLLVARFLSNIAAEDAVCVMVSALVVVVVILSVDVDKVAIVVVFVTSVVIA
uniref:Uncharacterized protein n=1 Tax=Glossina austeni TaxID=7395 RepID=A0A1A9V4T8_GLOAU